MRFDPQFWRWFVRSTGIVAWLLITITVSWGLLLSTRLIDRRSAPAWLLDVHRFVGALTLMCTGLHLAGIAADRSLHFRAVDLFVPGITGWRPARVCGITAMYLLVAVEGTSLLMRRLPRRLWRAVHGASFVSFLGVSLHGGIVGTDRTNRLYAATAVVCIEAVAFLVTYRLVAGRRVHRRATRTPARSTS